MPSRNLKPCAQAGCGELVSGGFCEAHAAARPSVDVERGSATARGYGKRWEKVRDFVRARDKFCVKCREEGKVGPIDEVDHIKPKAQGGTDDPENLQGLCAAHHHEKTANEKRRRRFA